MEILRGILQLETLLRVTIICIVFEISTSLGQWTGPNTAYAEIGTDVRLTCSYQEPLDISEIIWLDGDIIFVQGNISINAQYANFAVTAHNSSSSTLTITSVEIEDEGRYSCRSAAVRTRSQVALLHVEVRSTLSMSEVPIFMEGQDYNISCKAVGGRPPESITWYLFGHPLDYRVTTTMSTSPDSPNLTNTLSILTITAARFQNGEELTCDSSGHMVHRLNQQKETSLIVVYAPDRESQDIIFIEDRTHDILWINCYVFPYARPTPPISTFTVFINGSSTPSAVGNSSIASLSPIPSSCVNVSCHAANGVGSVVTSKLLCSDEGGVIPTQMPLSGDCSATTGIATSFGIVIILLVVALVFFSVSLRKRPSKILEKGAINESLSRDITNTLPSEEYDEPSVYEMLSSHSYEHSYAALQSATDRDVVAKQIDAKVPPRNIRFHSKISPIGEVGIGQVWKGEIRGVPGKEKKKVLAAIRDLSGFEDVRSNLLQTISLLWKLPYNIHVVKCLGCCVEQTLIVNEYVPNGTLLTYLQTNAGGKSRSSYRDYINVKSIVRRVKETDLLIFAWQIAKGMQFLSFNKIIHGNLRANNVLLTEGIRCKIADYGLNILHPKKDIHRWMSPEAMTDCACSTNYCDVWSYGVLLWELVTLGAQPYPGISDETLKEKVCSGYRMTRPRHCTEELYKIIESCWKTNKRQRSQFDELLQKVDRMLETANDYLSLNSMEDDDVYTDIPEQPRFE